jgi:hypothetical protein
MPNAPLLLTQAAYARHRGVTRQAVREAIRAGRITVDADGLLDPVAADAQWQARTRPRARPAGGASQAAPDTTAGGTGYLEAKRRQAVADAEVAELRLAELRGELVRVADVRHAYGRRLAGLREALLSLPPRLAPVLAAEPDQLRVLRALEDALHHALRESAEQ